MPQLKHEEWRSQWEMFKDNELFLFREWIEPNTVEDFRGKEVLECGCGNGQHTSFVAPYAKRITAVDLNTADIARKQNAALANARFVEADIAAMDLKEKFDVVFSIGVIHHTDDPEKTFDNLKRHVKPGGKLIIWVYSEEGNFLVKNIVEPLKRALLSRMKRDTLRRVSEALTLLMYIPVYSIYLLPLKSLPYYEYFKNFRRLSFYRNCLNVFDKLNAPQTFLIKRETIVRWFNDRDFREINISDYKKVSWRASGVKR